MRLQTWLVCGSVALLTLAGCGSKGGEEANTQAPANEQNAITNASANNDQQAVAETISPEVQQRVAQLQAPDDVVAAFLTAMRDADKQVILALLSEKAREATSRHEELTIQPPGSPNSTYRVGNVSLVGDDQSGAHVSSIWSEGFNDGSSIEYEVVWVLRREQPGWRVAGMSTQVEEGAPPVFLNFEQPDEMLAVLTEAAERQEAAAAAAASAANAGGIPADPNAGNAPAAFNSPDVNAGVNGVNPGFAPNDANGLRGDTPAGGGAAAYQAQQTRPGQPQPGDFAPPGGAVQPGAQQR